MKRIRSPILLLLVFFSVLRVHAQYSGGDGSGNALTLLPQVSCSAIVYPAIYGGGNENSLSMLLLTQVSCTVAAYPSIFLGGNETSENSLLLTQTSCAAIVYPNIFAGGNDSSFNSIDLEQTSCATPVYPSIFAGGIDDGYSGTALLQTSCTTPADPGIYAGGNSNVNTGVTYLTACAPFADFEADTQFVCEGDTVNFTDLSLGTPITWDWTFNGGTPLSSSVQNPFVVYNTAGSYDVQLVITTGSGGNSITKTTYIVVGAKPSASLVAGGPATFCGGDSVQLTVNPAYTSYAWNTGATTQSVYANTSGNYFSVVTAANGCQANTDTISVMVLSNPVPSISASGPTTLCNADTLTLTSSPGVSYNWLPGSESTQAIEVTANGTYYVEVTYANGCSNISAPINAVFGTTPATPVVTPSGPLTFCAGDSVVLTSSPATSYLWLPGSSSTQNITVTNSGTYFVEVGNGTGCTATSVAVTVNVLSNTPTPAITASGALSFCSGDSVVLTSSPAASYSWSPGGQTSQSITVLNSGTYFVQADNGNNCPSVSASVVVSTGATPATPTIGASGPLTFCAGDSVVLTASASASYNWLPGGQTTQSITVTSTGNYYVETGNGTGCTAASTPVSVTVNAVPATPTIGSSGPIVFCAGDSVVLTASAAASYNWLPGGQTTQSITVTSTGNYYVETGNGTGCTAASAPVSVTVNVVPATPTIGASGPLTFCSGDSVVLTASAAASYNWLPGGQTTQSITVTSTGNYYVETGNGTGCTAASAPVSVTVNAVPATPTIGASGPLTFCAGDSVVLTASAAASYNWLPGGQTTQSITVTTTGNYYVETSNGSCTAQSLLISVNVLPSPAVPLVSASGSLTFCEGDSVVLTSSLADSYVWNPGGSINQSLTVFTSGTYFVEVSNSSGCSANSLPVLVTVNPNPTINLNGSLVACVNTVESYTTTNLGGVDYLWTIDNGTLVSGIGTNSVNVLFPDTGQAEVMVIVTNSTTSCFSQSLIGITVLPAPQAYAGNDVSVCEGQSVQLQAFGGATYSWLPPTGLSDPTIFNPVANPSTTTQYIVVVANGSCTDSDTVLVTVNPLPTVDAGPDAYISSDSCAVLAGSGTGTYSWWPVVGLSNAFSATPAACPDSTITYYLTVEGAGGCSATDSVTVYVTSSGDELVFPNTFTPNGDGKNDVWYIGGLSRFPANRLTVFNRWGNQVYDAQPYENNWDGTSLGRELPDGTYFYVFDRGNGEELLKGYLMIIR